MITKDKVTEICCYADDFCLELNQTIGQHGIAEIARQKSAIEK